MPADGVTHGLDDAWTRSPAQPELLVSAWTSAGAALPLSADERSPHDFIERVKAASDAGFTGFGLLHADLGPAIERHGLDEMRTILVDHGIRHLELEMLGNGFALGAPRAASDGVRRDLLGASEVLRPRQVKVGGDYAGNSWPIELLAEEFTLLCQQAADAGTRVALEPMPFANIRDIHAGRTLIDTVGHPAGGLLVDIWHVCRAHTPYAEVAALPADVIFAVELDDADETVVGTLLEDTLHQRRLCGEGSFDISGFVTAIRQTGYNGPWGVEIISHEHRARSLAEQVRRAFDTTAPFLS